MHEYANELIWIFNTTWKDNGLAFILVLTLLVYDENKLRYA